MPPRKIKKDPKADWVQTADGRLVNPNSEEGLLARGVIKPREEEAPFTEEVVPCNRAATLLAMPQPEEGAVLYKKLPGDCEVFKLHLADETFPDVEPALAVTCDSDDVGKVLESMLGDGSKPRYLNPKTGLEFEWTVAPPGFYAAPKGWDKPKTAEEIQAAADDDDKE
mmetsp:Transcript_2704/g.8494  ORF Transcript_2704/g.8494 Transcript_2704/m.8494 type:complete len:168 (-) Transcript_2704:1343-1846(-)